MLRRPPTTLTLTSEDIASYEDRKQRVATAARLEQQHQQKAQVASAHHSPARDHHLLGLYGVPKTILDPPTETNSSNSSPIAHQQMMRNRKARQQYIDDEDIASSDNEQQQRQLYDTDDEDEEYGDRDGDEEMADYDMPPPAPQTIASGMQNVPRLPRPAHPSIVEPGLGAVTPPSNHTQPQTQIPQAPTRPGPGIGRPATTQAVPTTTMRRRGPSARAATTTASGAAAARVEPQIQPRMTRSRDERLGISANTEGAGTGTRRTAR